MAARANYDFQVLKQLALWMMEGRRPISCCWLISAGKQGGGQVALCGGGGVRCSVTGIWC